MRVVTSELLIEQLELADALREGRDNMREPEDLPGRYGRVVRALNHLLEAVDAEAVLASGWAVWRHGYVGRVTQDVDIVLPAARVDEFLRVAGVSGFDVLPHQPGRWPKLMHRETGIQVDILPEGERPGVASRPGPTLLPAPSTIGAKGAKLQYITLAALIELKLAAGRARDESDIVELVRANDDQVEFVRRHLAKAHPSYVTQFDRLVQRAREQQDE
jgi:hypothetical protein